MATTPKTEKQPRAKKEPQTPVQRVTDILKKAALQNKVSADELDSVANLAAALKTFMQA